LRFPVHKVRQNASILSCPIERENLIVGHLTLETDLPRKWKDEDLRFLSDIANIVSVGVANAVYYEKVESLAVHDSLTDLYVRYRFDERVEEEFARARASGSPLSLILFDLDHFKNVNDQWGHQAGDMVLKSVAEIVLGQTRETDFCARYGGEEIAVLMPRTQIKNSYLIAERIRKTVESHSTGPDKVQVTLSGGVTTLLPSMKSPQNFIESADQALYQAKDGGRNRLVKVEP
jgi:diguanylate cyclase (GGDEF)-like protein